MPHRGPGLDRRTFALLTAAGAVFARTPAVAADDPAIAAIEAKIGGRVGFMALDVGSGRTLAHRANERFPLDSTFKWLLAAAVLARIDQGVERLDRRIRYGLKDVLPGVSPVTRAHAGEGSLTVGELCAAAIGVSDNTAANLLLVGVGGPAGLTRWLRSQGDPVTRLDRNEPGLNEGTPGDPRDTTTPAAAVADLRRFVLGDALSPGSRAKLAEWLVSTRTGLKRLRGGLPADWRVGDKTGTGAHASTNDVAVAWPPSGGPVLMAGYLTAGTASAEAREAALADLGRLAAKAFGARA